MNLARQWQPARRLVPYALALGVLDRLLGHALFGSDLFSATGFVIDTYVVLMAALLAYHRVLGRLLVRQYPWMYRHFLIFGWRAKAFSVDPPTLKASAGELWDTWSAEVLTKAEVGTGATQKTL
jgi:hypothetical protein